MVNQRILVGLMVALSGVLPLSLRAIVDPISQVPTEPAVEPVSEPVVPTEPSAAPMGQRYPPRLAQAERSR